MSAFRPVQDIVRRFALASASGHSYIAQRLHPKRTLGIYRMTEAPEVPNAISVLRLA